MICFRAASVQMAKIELPARLTATSLSAARCCHLLVFEVTLDKGRPGKDSFALAAERVRMEISCPTRKAFSPISSDKTRSAGYEYLHAVFLDRWLFR